MLEAGAKLDRPVMIQFSEGGSAFFVGNSLPNKSKEASVLGAVAGAHYVRLVAPSYGVTVFVHSDRCDKKLLPWFDGMLEADKAYFAAHGEPLFSSHMLGLSEESREENIAICAECNAQPPETRLNRRAFSRCPLRLFCSVQTSRRWLR